MNSLKVIKLLLVLLVINSCEQTKDLDIVLPYDGDDIVVYAYLSDSIHYAEIYQVQEVLDNAPNFTIDIEQLALYQDEELVGEFEKDGFNYVLNKQIDPESEFQVSLETIDNSVISEMLHFPEKVTIENYQFQLNEDSSKMLLNFSFNDLEGENFYAFQIDQYFEGQINNNDNSLFYENFRSVFSDAGFENQSYSYEEEISLDFFQYESGAIVGFENADAFSISLYSLSKEYYQFYESKRENGNVIGNLDDSNKPLWTNMINGHGFAGTYWKDFVLIEF